MAPSALNGAGLLVKVGGDAAAVTADKLVQLLDGGAAKVVVDGAHVNRAVVEQLPAERLIVTVHVNGNALSSAANADTIVPGAAVPLGQLVDFVKQTIVPVATAVHVVLSDDAAVDAVVPVLAEVKKVAGVAQVLASGLSLAKSIAQLDKVGVDVVLSATDLLPLNEKGDESKFDLVSAFAAPLVTDRPDGLFATVVVDEQEVTLGLVYSSVASIREAVRSKRGVYQSRKHGLWYKGETSGATQDLLRVHVDCDRDALKSVVHQNGAGK